MWNCSSFAGRCIWCDCWCRRKRRDWRQDRQSRHVFHERGRRGTLRCRRQDHPGTGDRVGTQSFFRDQHTGTGKQSHFERSRRLKPAAISSLRLFAAVCLSFSFLLFRLEMYAIWNSSYCVWQISAGQARSDLIDVIETLRTGMPVATTRCCLIVGVGSNYQ